MSVLAGSQPMPAFGIDSDRARDAAPTRRLVRLARLVRMGRHFLLAWLVAVVAGRRLSNPTRARILHTAARSALRILAVRLVLRGAPPVTDGRVLVVANHVSWLDIYALNAVAGARFVAKREVRGWPLVGIVAARFGSFFITRGSCRDAARVKDAIAAALCARERVVVFPEGTTTDGTRVGRFYAALLEAAVETGARVQPVAIRYPGPGGRPHPAAAFIDDMSFATSLTRILREPELHVELTFGAPLDGACHTRRELVAAARDFVVATLGLRATDAPPSRARRRRAA